MHRPAISSSLQGVLLPVLTKILMRHVPRPVASTAPLLLQLQHILKRDNYHAVMHLQQRLMLLPG